MNPRKDRAACGRSRCVSCGGFTNGKDISKSDRNTNCTSSDILSDEVQFALGHFFPKYQPVIKSRRANLGECSLSASHSAMAGTPKGK